VLLSILIAVSSRTDLLADCLASLQRHMPDDLSYETIVVLNELDPAHASVLQGRHPTVRFLRSPVNLGMAGSANRARREASGRFLVTLHDDATVEPGWAEALLAAAEQHPRAGAIGSKILFPDGRLQSAGAILWRSGVTTPPWTGAAPAARDVAHARAVDYCGTCSLLIRAEAFDAVGGFDEAIYPGYFVDVDLGLALRAQGYYVLCEPRSLVRHHRHASSGKLSGRSRSPATVPIFCASGRPPSPAMSPNQDLATRAIFSWPCFAPRATLKHVTRARRCRSHANRYRTPKRLPAMTSNVTIV
jgi:GT2 family glycosyltransferase/predicted RNA-binding Zn-ribbon protein involved in translation (DUF1610 family)